MTSTPRYEQLSFPDSPHPLQQAFVDEQAAQCGYCINSMTTQSAAPLTRNATPSEQEVKARVGKQSLSLRHAFADRARGDARRRHLRRARYAPALHPVGLHIAHCDSGRIDQQRQVPHSTNSGASSKRGRSSVSASPMPALTKRMEGAIFEPPCHNGYHDQDR
jgi:hypothetical protein